MRCGHCKETNVDLAHVRGCATPSAVAPKPAAGMHDFLETTARGCREGVCNCPRAESYCRRTFCRVCRQHVPGRVATGCPGAPAQAAPPPRKATPTKGVTPGVYKRDGVVYVVKPTRDKQRVYASRLVEIAGERLVESGDVVQIEFAYEAGAIYRLEPEDRMTVEEGKALTIRYGRCLCCGRRLKAATSVERGIGPVCIKYYAA